MCVCVCVCVQDSSTIKTQVCVSSEDSRESVRSLESVLICVDFYNSSKSKYIHYYMYSKKIRNAYKMYMNILIYLFSRIRKVAIPFFSS